MKNKKSIIILIVVSIVVSLSVLGILYFTTDLFKTEQQLFYKYIGKIKIVNSGFVNQYNLANERITKNSNSSNMTIDFKVLEQNLDANNNEEQNFFTVKSNGLKNYLTEQSYRDFVFSSNEQNFLTLKYLKDGNVYAILADNIVAKYLAVENSNLKEFFAKLGVEDTANIPNSIPTNYEEILKIEESTLKQLKQTYGMLIYNNISKENFYKIKNSDNTEIIGVSLSEKETVNILKAILENAQNDNVLLNLIADKARLLNYNNITVETIQTNIQTFLNENTNKEYSTQKDFVKFSLLIRNKEIIKLNLETNIIEEDINTNQEASINKKTNVEMDFSEINKIVVSLKENDVELINITTDYIYNEDNIDINIELEVKESNDITNGKIQYKINNYQTDNINKNIIVYINSNNQNNYQINLSNNIILKQDVQISKLTTENSAKLNDMTQEELQLLFTALTNRIITLYGLQNGN